MTDLRRTREPFVHGASAGLGAVIGPALLGAFDATLVLRSGALTLALSLVVAALVQLVRLGRSEWRREAPGSQAYWLAAARFVTAFVLVVGATT